MMMMMTMVIRSGLWDSLNMKKKKKSTDSVSLNALGLLKWVLSRRKCKVGETKKNWSVPQEEEALEQVRY